MVTQKDQPAWICSDASVHNNERDAYGHEAASSLRALTGSGWAPEPVVAPALTFQIQRDLGQELKSVRTAFQHWTNIRRLAAVNTRIIHLANSLDEMTRSEQIRIELIQLTAFLVLWIEKLDSHP